jgi:hypothetical protein
MLIAILNGTMIATLSETKRETENETERRRKPVTATDL